jgi:hypothetical protein
MSKIDELLKRYEDEKAGIKPTTSNTESTGKMAGADKLKKMFVPQAAEEEFRIILPEGAENYYEEAYFHEAKVNGQFKKLYCPKKNDGKACPMCEQRDADLQAAFDAKHEKGSPESKAAFKAANVWEPKKFYIFKGVDKLRLADGLKFWRIKASHDNTGAFDDVLDLAGTYSRKTGNDFTDPLKGFDFKIKVADMKTPNGVKYKGIKRIDQGDSSPLVMFTSGDKVGQPDTEKIEEILTDTLTWREVFSPATINNLLDSYQYLKAVMEDCVPRWDAEKKRFFAKDENGVEVELDLRNPQGGASSTTAAPAAKAAPVKITKESLKEATSLGDDDNELPF